MPWAGGKVGGEPSGAGVGDDPSGACVGRDPGLPPKGSVGGPAGGGRGSVGVFPGAGVGDDPSGAPVGGVFVSLVGGSDPPGRPPNGSLGGDSGGGKVAAPDSHLQVHSSMKSRLVLVSVDPLDLLDDDLLLEWLDLLDDDRLLE